MPSSYVGAKGLSRMQSESDRVTSLDPTTSRTVGCASSVFAEVLGRSSMQYTRLKGMTDLYGEDLALWQAFEVLSRKVLERFGYREIRTPLLEMTELFQRGLGEDSDVVQKEMYTFP